MEWITANDNSNEEKSTIKVILVAARNVMNPLSEMTHSYCQPFKNCDELTSWSFFVASADSDSS
jgi:hypothetical protein